MWLALALSAASAMNAQEAPIGSIAAPGLETAPESSGATDGASREEAESPAASTDTDDATDARPPEFDAATRPATPDAADAPDLEPAADTATPTTIMPDTPAARAPSSEPPGTDATPTPEPVAGDGAPKAAVPNATSATGDAAAAHEAGVGEAPKTPDPAAPSQAAPAVPAMPASPADAAATEPPLTLSTFIDDPLGGAARLLAPPEAGAPDAARDLSPIGMFRSADVVVKLVMLGLILASLVTWTILLAKLVELAVARRRTRATLRILQRATTAGGAATAIGRRRGPAARMLHAARHEVTLSTPALADAGDGGVKERVTSTLDQIVASAGRRAGIGTGILATIGSTAPFVGLFGTVWGIMNAFIGISEAQSSSLAVVAPGIAEALLATALGLIAAIPAVVIYNFFARSIGSYRHALSEVAASIERLISRELDFRQSARQETALMSAAE